MKLFIAEKPSLGRVIAEGLGGGRAEKGFIQGRDWVVTWCFGHLYEMCMPDEYDARFKKWTREDLPIVPTLFRLKPRKDASAQIKVIRSLVKDASEIVNAGDPDREGQLLVDEVLWELRNRKPVSRVWLAALDEQSVRKALATLTSNECYRGLGDAALARSRADWLVGLNLTRGYTVRAGRTVTVGRVQTPTLNLVVQRDLEIENFKAKDFFTLEVTFQHPLGTYTGIWNHQASPLVRVLGEKSEKWFDEEGRCLHKPLTEKVLTSVVGKNGQIAKIQNKEHKEPPPLPFSLSDLQAEASRLFGFGAKKTIDLAQALYERHKAITYPRTDCRYLSSGQFQEVEGTLSGMGQADPRFRPYVERANVQSRNRAFNDSRVTAHTAIIPTNNPNLPIKNLSSDEFKLYNLIRRRYLALFYPDHRYQQVTLTTVVAKEPFVSKVKTTLALGWKTLFTKEVGDAKSGPKESMKLPKGVQEGDTALSRSAEVLAKQTTPPPSFTEGTLIRAMANIARYVDDQNAKKRLRETSGIGTEATRAGIIENLKKRGFLLSQGKKITSSDAGRELIQVVAPPLKDPVTTAQWEDRMLDIEKGRAPLSGFIEGIGAWVSKTLELVDQAEFKILAAQPSVIDSQKKNTSRNNKPTTKMVAYAKRLAKQKGLKRLPNGVASDFQVCRLFLDKHGSSNKNPQKPSKLS
ncbi:MAG: DNA topoisomerase III [Myxococcota bacterium]|nr:DNA topoisomerase III [Myxococcota bacterium]